MKRILISVLSISIIIVFLSCQKPAEEKKTEVVKKYIPSVCIEENAWVLTAPTYDKKKSSRHTVLSLGEKVIWFGITAIDSADNNKEFIQIMLSDSSQGWTRSWNVVTNAKPAVIIDTVNTYDRPKEINLTDDKLDPLKIIAVLTEKEDWLEVVDKANKNPIWIKNKNISFNDIDIAVATQYTKIKSKGEKRKEAILDIVDNEVFQNSILISKLRRIVFEMVKEQEAQVDTTSTGI
jgi:hypothetical protein